MSCQTSESGNGVYIAGFEKRRRDEKRLIRNDRRLGRR